jgi:glycine hydroxymethyltransferase
MFSKDVSLASFDPALAQAIANEDRRQEEHIELIASENYTSPAVMEAQGSQLTNKYAEGYPGKRYYGGCEYVDVVEPWPSTAQRAVRCRLCQRAAALRLPGQRRRLLALLQPGDTVLGMSLAHGGHLTHGAKRQLLRQDLQRRPVRHRRPRPAIDYDEVERLAASTSRR